MNTQFKAREKYRDVNVVSKYDEHRFTSIKGYITDLLEKKLIARAFKAADMGSGTVLDLPCGTGRLSLYLAERGFDVVGVDISDAMVSASIEKAKATTFSNKMTFQVADAENLPFNTSSFDAVTSLRLFGHVPPNIRIKMLKEFKRISAGPLIVAYYHANSIQCYLRKQNRKENEIPWYPVTYSQIRHEMMEVGLNLEKIKPMLLGLSETLVVVATG